MRRPRRLAERVVAVLKIVPTAAAAEGVGAEAKAEVMARLPFYETARHHVKPDNLKRSCRIDAIEISEFIPKIRLAGFPVVGEAARR